MVVGTSPWCFTVQEQKGPRLRCSCRARPRHGTRKHLPSLNAQEEDSHEQLDDWTPDPQIQILQEGL